MLDVQSLSKRYRGQPVVDGVSFSLCRGEVLGLLGPNGAGKTSIISMVLGLLRPDTGRILIEGTDLAEHRAQALATTNFAAVYAPLPGNLSVRQNLRFFGRLYGVRGLTERIDELLEQFELQHHADTRCGLLSSGEQTRVSLAKAMLNRPHLLLLDEPTASLDPATARELRQLIRSLAGDAGILWTSHNMLEVQAVCDRVLFLSRGQVLLTGDPRLLPARHGAADLEELFVRVAREPLTLREPA
ncbi:MAG: ABC transporter ATP-binding protein [Gammaproteobacteria bacterium]|nr:ABC transporter ATP-binding protein [Gammaproteobacteria bacterium]